jgi:septal ring factor EnvC (AmiA/AmiB activator)
MMDLGGILAPVVVATMLSVSGAFVVARYSGPAQQAYIQALQGRLAVVEQERDDAATTIPKLESRIHELEKAVEQLERLIGKRDREIADLYRRLDEDERRLPRP